MNNFFIIFLSFVLAGCAEHATNDTIETINTTEYILPAPTLKTICKDTTNGTICKTIKIYKKLDGTPVPQL